MGAVLDNTVSPVWRARSQGLIRKILQVHRSALVSHDDRAAKQFMGDILSSSRNWDQAFVKRLSLVARLVAEKYDQASPEVKKKILPLKLFAPWSNELVPIAARTYNTRASSLNARDFLRFLVSQEAELFDFVEGGSSENGAAWRELLIRYLERATSIQEQNELAVLFSQSHFGEVVRDGFAKSHQLKVHRSGTEPSLHDLVALMAERHQIESQDSRGPNRLSRRLSLARYKAWLR